MQEMSIDFSSCCAKQNISKHKNVSIIIVPVSTELILFSSGIWIHQFRSVGNQYLLDCSGHQFLFRMEEPQPKAYTH